LAQGMHLYHREERSSLGKKIFNQ